MPVAALLLVVCVQPGLALPLALRSALASDDNGPPPGSPYPPPPPLVEDQRQPVAVHEALRPGDAESPPPSRYPPPPKPLPPRVLPPPPELPPSGPPDVGARLLWGLGARGGLGVVQTSVSMCPGPLPCLPVQGLQPSIDGALYLRLGAELNDLWGVEGELHGGLLLFQGGYVGGALTLDVTPVDWFTVAVGPLVDQYESFSVDTTFATPALGGTLRLDIHPWSARVPTGRSAFTIGVVADLAAALSQSDGQPVGGVYLTLGYAHY